MDVRPNFEAKLLAAFAAASLVVVVLAAITWKVSQDAIEAALWVSHSHEVLDNVARAGEDTVLIESITRGYIISGDAGPLAERDMAISAREIVLRRIRDLTADNARQQERWARLREAADGRLAISRRAIQLRETEGFDAARAYSATAPVRETRERYLQVIREMEEEERRLLEERQAEQLREREIAVAAGALAALALIALLAATHFLIRRQMRSTEASRRALELANVRIQSVLDTVADGIITIGEHGIVETLNPAAERIFGYAAAEVIGHNVKMLMPEPYHSEHDGYLERYRVTGKARVIGIGREVAGRRKDGSTFPLELAVSEMRLNGERNFTGVVRDITVRKHTEAALRESEENLSTTLHSIGDAVLATDIEGRVTRMNPVAERLTGWPFAEAQGRPIDEVFRIVNEQTRAPAVVPVAKVIETGELQGLGNHTALIARDGTERPVADSAAPIRDAAGQVSGVVLVFRDVTAERQVERMIREQNELLEQRVRERTVQLRESEERLNFSLRPSHTGGWDLDLLDHTAHRTLEHDRIFGHGSLLPQWTYEMFLEHVLPEDRAEVDRRFREATAAQTDWSFECRIRRVDGEIRWIWAAGKHQRDETGQMQRMAGIVQDITERKQAEEALRRLNLELEAKVAARTKELEQANLTLTNREEEIRSVVENIVDCIITIDEEGIIHSANQVVEKIFGYALEDVIGQNVSMLMPEPHRGAHDGYLENYRRTGQARIIGIGREVEGLHKNGERIALDLAISEYFVRGQRFFTGILRDIRDRVRIVKDLEQARLDAEQANRAKSTFLAAMSHEIRTPMNGVIGMVDVLHQTSLKGYQVEIVDTIRDSAYSLLGIIEDILDFSKIEAGRLEIERASISVTAVVEQVCDMLDHLAAKKGVELTLFTDPTIPEEVLSDALRLRQVLVNLASNAIKFSSGGPRPGKVSIRARLAEHGSERVTVEFQVADNGIGMGEETQARLFTSFTQADVSTTRRFGGTGLGLAISRQLVNLMGGEITLRSDLDQGSTFRVRLPFAPLPPKSDAGRVVPDIAGLSCLAVGSAEGLADDLAVYLTHGGAAVERVSDLAIARKRASAYPAGLSVWVIDAGDERPSVDELHVATGARPDLEVRFVVIGRGQRRKPRAAASDLVLVDGNALSRQAFLKAVAIAAGRAQSEAETPSGKTEAEVSPPSHEEARRQGRLILVAEDNETNQKVILRQLGLLGFAADIAGNGRDALERWRTAKYALLLTDLHMPKMDGYELAAAIRTEEQGLRHTPIVALTANALAGEAERCREAGMDDYLSKPTPLEKLKAMLTNWLPVAAEPVPDLNVPLAPQAAALLPVDVSVLKTLVGDDAAVIREFLQDFRASSARIAAELRAACQQGRATVAGAAAHKLKSSARSVGALKLGDLCAELEQAGKTGENKTLAVLLPRFEQELATVEQYLDSLIAVAVRDRE